MIDYDYNAWGVVSSSVNSSLSGDLLTQANLLLVHNPYVYKGYFYDSETGYYYLKSRYYDPRIHRFISADKIDYLDPQSLSSLNLYVYCGDNPVMMMDENGNFWDYALDGISVAWSLYDFVKNPTWKNAGWLALDVILGIIPFVPAIGKGIRGLSKVDDVHDIIVIGNSMDRVKDAARLYEATYYSGYKSLNILNDMGRITDATTKMKFLGRVDNAKWLFKNVFNGSELIDIGKDGRSIFKYFVSAYGMEKRLLFYWWHLGHTITRGIRLF